MRRLEKIPAGKGGNSLQEWHRFRNPLVVIYNFMIIYPCKYCPSLRLKNALLRATGMKIGKGARIGLCAMFDIFWPEKIQIGENAIIGYNATVLAHEFLQNELRVGATKIGNGALVGANSTVLAGVEIGDGARVSAMSLVNADVPKGAFAEGVPIRISRKGKGR